MVKIDMSPKAVTARLRQVLQLRKVCYVLGKAGKAHRDKKAAKTKEASKANRNDLD